MDGEHVGGPVPAPVRVAPPGVPSTSPASSAAATKIDPCACTSRQGYRRSTHRGPAQRPAARVRSSHGGGLPAAAEAWDLLLRLLLLLLLLRGLRSWSGARRA